MLNVFHWYLYFPVMYSESTRLIFVCFDRSLAFKCNKTTGSTNFESIGIYIIYLWIVIGYSPELNKRIPGSSGIFQKNPNLELIGKVKMKSVSTQPHAKSESPKIHKIVEIISRNWKFQCCTHDVATDNNSDPNSYNNNNKHNWTNSNNLNNTVEQ